MNVITETLLSCKTDVVYVTGQNASDFIFSVQLQHELYEV